MKKILISSVAAAALAVLSSPVFAQMPQAVKQVVGVAAVEETSNVQSRRYTGQVTTQAFVNVTPRVSGEILKLGFNDGDFVKKGQMLYAIEKTQYEAAVKKAEAAVAECQVHLEDTRSDFARKQILFEKHTISEADIDDLKFTLKAREAVLAASEAALDIANEDLSHTTITAAIDGQVGVTNFTVGNYITPSSGPLVTIIQMEPIRVRFSISMGDYLSGYDGSPAKLKENGRITLKLSDGSEYSEEGTIEFLNNEANVKTDAIQIFASFPNAEHKLIPGSTVTVTLSKKSGDSMPAVPPSAVMHDAKESFVYVVGDGNKIERRTVELGDMTKTHQLIKSGLKTGERVVYQGTHKVMPGDEIIPAAEGKK